MKVVRFIFALFFLSIMCFTEIVRDIHYSETTDTKEVSWVSDFTEEISLDEEGGSENQTELEIDLNFEEIDTYIFCHSDIKSKIIFSSQRNIGLLSNRVVIPPPEVLFS